MDKRGALERALSEVEGAGEHGVRILDPRASVSEEEPPAGGRAYMEWLLGRERVRRDREQRGEALSLELATELGDVLRARRTEPLSTSHGLATVTHLVPREMGGPYAEGVSRFRERHAELRFLVSGPWPPYSFVP